MEFNWKGRRTSQLVPLRRDIFNIGVHASGIKNSNYTFPDFHFKFTHKYRISSDKCPRCLSNVKLQPFNDHCSHHIETTQLIC